MGWLQFFASAIGSLAWPLALVVTVCLLRKPIASLLPLLQRLKFRELELEFGKSVEEVSAEIAKELPPAPPTDGKSSINEVAALVKIAEASPRAAVLQAWIMVEQTAYEAARALGWQPPSNKASNGTFAIKFLARHPALESDRIDLLQQLRHLRNQAAHAPELALGKSAAIEYASSAARVARYLHTIAIAQDRKPPP
jgi:hypothetical protein